MGGFRRSVRRLKHASITEVIVAIAAVAVAAIAVAVVFFYHPHPPPPNYHGSAPTAKPYSVVNFSGEVGV